MRTIACLTLVALALAVVSPAQAPAAEEKVKIDDKTKKAMEKALEWLKETQNKDGSWGNNSAITSFVLLAFMSQGHLPGQGKYGPEVAKGVRNLVAGAREADGYLVGNTGGNMYAHGMATLALSQVWGMTGDEEVKKVLKKAVDLAQGYRTCRYANDDGTPRCVIGQLAALEGLLDGAIWDNIGGIQYPSGVSIGIVARHDENAYELLQRYPAVLLKDLQQQWDMGPAGLTPEERKTHMRRYIEIHE